MKITIIVDRGIGTGKEMKNQPLFKCGSPVPVV
jgi:hypothetical protein